jgi:hypothetical protein
MCCFAAGDFEQPKLRFGPKETVSIKINFSSVKGMVVSRFLAPFTVSKGADSYCKFEKNCAISRISDVNRKACQSEFSATPAQ